MTKMRIVRFKEKLEVGKIIALDRELSAEQSRINNYSMMGRDFSNPHLLHN